MIITSFDKQQALSFLHALRKGEPFLPSNPVKGWSHSELITLGGVFLYDLTYNFDILKAVLAQIEGKNYQFPNHREHAEAEAMDVRENVRFGFYVVMGLMQAVITDRYDSKYEEQINLALNASMEDPKDQAQIIMGLKPDGE